MGVGYLPVPEAVKGIMKVSALSVLLYTTDVYFNPSYIHPLCRQVQNSVVDNDLSLLSSI